MFVLFYVHRKGMSFPSPFTFIHPKVSTLSHSNVITYPHCFLTAYKMTSRPSVLAGTSDSKNPDPYYYCKSTIHPSDPARTSPKTPLYLSLITWCSCAPAPSTSCASWQWCRRTCKATTSPWSPWSHPRTFATRTPASMFYNKHITPVIWMPNRTKF